LNERDRNRQQNRVLEGRRRLVVVQERADWGVTLDTIARGAGLGFIPVQHEQYDFVTPSARADRAGVKAFRALLAEPSTREALVRLGMKP